jgi:hypothetical protein
METKAFKASVVVAEEYKDLNSFIVGFCENKDGTGESLQLQRGLSFSDEDRRVKQDTSCIVLESGATKYGGVTAISLRDRSIEIRVNKRTATALGYACFRVEFDAREATVHALKKGLRRVFPPKDRPLTFDV